MCIAFPCILVNLVYAYSFPQQFMGPRSRDKKQAEEWSIPLKSVEDIHEVCLFPYQNELLLF